MKTVVRAVAPIAIAVFVAACGTTYYGVTNPQPRCYGVGSTCYYGTDCCSLTCTNNMCIK